MNENLSEDLDYSPPITPKIDSGDTSSILKNERPSYASIMDTGSGVDGVTQKNQNKISELQSRIQFEKSIVFSSFSQEMGSLPAGYSAWLGRLASQYNLSPQDTPRDLEGKLQGLQYVKSHIDDYLSTFHALENQRSRLSSPYQRMAFEKSLSNLQNNPFSSVQSYAELLENLPPLEDPLVVKEREVLRKKQEEEQKQKQKKEAEDAEQKLRKQKDDERQMQEQMHTEKESQKRELEKQRKLKEENENFSQQVSEKNLNAKNIAREKEEKDKKKADEKKQKPKDVELSLSKEERKEENSEKILPDDDWKEQGELKEEIKRESLDEKADFVEIIQESVSPEFSKETLLPLTEDVDSIDDKKNIPDELDIDDSYEEINPNIYKLEQKKSEELKELRGFIQNLPFEDRLKFEFKLRIFEEQFSENMTTFETQKIFNKIGKLKKEILELSEGGKDDVEKDLDEDIASDLKKEPEEHRIHFKETEEVRATELEEVREEKVEEEKPLPILVPDVEIEKEEEPLAKEEKEQTFSELEVETENKEDIPSEPVPILIDEFEEEKQEMEELKEESLPSQTELDQKKEGFEEPKILDFVEDERESSEDTRAEEIVIQDAFEEKKEDDELKEKELEALEASSLLQKEDIREEIRESFGGIQDEIDQNSLKELELDKEVEVKLEEKNLFPDEDEGFDSLKIEKEEKEIEEKEAQKELLKVPFIPIPFFEKKIEETEEVEEVTKEVMKVLDEYRDQLEMLKDSTKDSLEDLALKIQELLELSEPSELVSQLQDLLAGIPPESLNEALSRILSTHFGNERVASFIMEYAKKTKDTLTVRELVSLLKSFASNMGVELSFQSFVAYQTLELKFEDFIWKRFTEIFTYSKSKKYEVSFVRKGSELTCILSGGKSGEHIERMSLVIVESFLS